jgi:bacterioferritin
MDEEEALRTLRELFAEEVEAAIRYLHLAVTVKGLDRLVVQKTLLEGMRETLQHAQSVAEKILQAGGVPKLEIRIDIPGELSSGTDAVRTALEFEEAALDGYRDLLANVQGKNTMLEEFARAQIAIESRHVADLQLLLKE